MVAMVCDGVQKIARGWKTSREVGNNRKEIGSDKNKCGGTGRTGSPLTPLSITKASSWGEPQMNLTSFMVRSNNGRACCEKVGMNRRQKLMKPTKDWTSFLV